MTNGAAARALDQEVLLGDVTASGRTDSLPQRARMTRAQGRAPRWLYAVLEVDAHGEGTFGSPTSIESDRAFQVRVNLRGDAIPDVLEGEPRASTRGMKLTLRAIHGTKACVTASHLTLVDVPNARLRVDGDPACLEIDEADLSVDVFVYFEVEVPAEAKLGLLYLELIGAEPRRPGGKTTQMSFVSLGVDGALRGPELETTRAFRIDPQPPSREDLVYITVSALEDAQISIRADCHYLDQSRLVHFVFDENLRIADALGKGKKQIIGFLQKARSFTQRDETLEMFIWLNGLIEAAEERRSRLCLAVVDLSESELPWEFLPLGGAFLGARIDIVRWNGFITDLEERRFRSEDVTRRGGVAGFLDPRQEISMERRAIDRLGGQCVGKGLAEAISYLSKNAEKLCLFYLACHGRVAIGRSEGDEHVAALAAGELKQDEDEVVHSHYLSLFSVKKGDRPLIFVNACHSGRVITTGNNRKVGLPMVFCSQLAEAFIGTLGAIRQDEASRLGCRILRLLRRMSRGSKAVGLAPAGILTALRRNAARHADLDDIRAVYSGKADSRTQERVNRLLNTFMYVYYGNPDFKIVVEAGAAPEQKE